jgi:alpha-beta hydrolase superfamily lysophospholipase
MTFPDLPLGLKVVLFVLSAYVGLGALLFLMQRQLLYYPGPPLPPEQSLQAAGLALWPDADYRGIGPAAGADYPNGTVVVFHGNAGTAADRAFYTRALGSLGYRVLLAEYPGYGGRPGRPGEDRFVADAKQTVALAAEQYGSPIFLLGESLGAGVASAVAADSTIAIDGLILITPWDNLPSLAQSIYWFFPTRWLVLDQYDNVQNLRTYAGPVAVVLAERDEVVPIRHGQRLFESVQSPKRLWVLQGAGHNSWPTQTSASWWRDVMAFIDPQAE